MAKLFKAWQRQRTPMTYLAVAVLVVGLLMVVEALIVNDAWRVRDGERQKLETSARYGTEMKARDLSQVFTDIYVTTRTIAMLPAIRRPPAHNRASEDDDVVDGRRFTTADAQTVLQLYQRLADVLSVSEVYVVYDGFKPAQGEVPFLMFDAEMVERFRGPQTAGQAQRAHATHGRNSLVPEVEDEEYAEIQSQLARLRAEHPLLPVSAPRGIAHLVSPPLVTCDNSQFPSAAAGHNRDRTGVMLSVPIYDEQTGALKGLVTSVVRLNVLEARLLDWPQVPVTSSEKSRMSTLGLERAALSDYVLLREGSGIVVADRRNELLQATVAGQARAGLTISVPLDGLAGEAWVLKRHVPQATFDAIEASARQTIAVRSGIALAVLLMLAGVAALVVRQSQAAARLQELADFDALTGLPNRRQLERSTDACLRAAAEQQGQLSLILVDLDNFKTINDVHGHDVGDALLVEVARRFQKQLSAAEDFLGQSAGAATGLPPSIGRLGGDEFLIILPRIADASVACSIGEMLIASLAVPVFLDGRSIHAHASMGAAMYPEHGTTPAQLLRCADQAMYAAKRMDESAMVLFQREVDQAAMRRMRLTADLRDGLAREEFELHYQCVVNVARRRVDSVEALIRWRHPELGLVSPAEFVPLLERSGVIVPTGLWALKKACQQLLAWRISGSSIESVAVNVSVVQLAQSDFCTDALNVVRATGIDPRRLTIEITESVLMDKPERSIAQLQQLRDAGVCIAIDDFGTGYSSLGYLRRLPVQVMKIDRSLLVDAVNQNGRAVLIAMVNLARELGLDCVAEGVETLEQFQLLRDVGCQRLQGYLFARPLPAADADAVARRINLHQLGLGENLVIEHNSAFGDLDACMGALKAWPGERMPGEQA
ncbi:MAG: EAL domain-containing protein [Burkholderiales bacterium]|nr:EAL domain-containing protein [Burkholderiales bacterium]